uniref:G-protein coupled receptors family 1 profile domain-containing protein n=1 Tax=Wuchereria bancrofti TaxID=6293 RepID=A0AAF5Q5T4_WUCBA
MAILFFTGIDRSMAILKPLRYRTMRRRISVPAMTIPAALYAVVILILACIYAINNDGKVICVLVAIYSGQFDWIWGILATLVNLATIILYAVLSRIIVKAETSNRNFELLQTLKIAVAFVGMGHLASTTIYMVTKFVNISDVTRFYIRCYAGVFINISVSFNWLFYYWRSEEYRNAFRRQFKKLPCLKNTVNLQTKHTMQQITTVH